MRPATLPSLLFVVMGFASNAQKLTLLPQVGVENSRTTITYNHLPSFAPLGGQLSPKLGARLDYQGKHGHGAFIGVATSRSLVSFNFFDAQTGMDAYKAEVANLRSNFEGGYQFSTKPIYFKKSASAKKPPAVASSAKRSCGDYSFRSRCSKYSGENSTAAKAVQAVNKGWSVSIKPSVGLALMSPVSQDISTQAQGNQLVYKYQAGNWNAAMIKGAAFEFGKNDQRKFTVSINYFKGIGNLGTKTLTTASEGKTTVTELRSKVSGWSLNAGIPITLMKKKTPVVQPAVIQKVEQKSTKPQSRCGQYRMRCGRSI